MAFLPAQLQNFTLAGSGVSISDTTMTLSSFTTIDGAPLALSDFGTKGYMTIEPGSRDREEQISFSGVTQNSNGTATLTGIKTVLFLSPYTETSGFTKSHPGGVVAVVTNTSGFYNQFGILANNEAITGAWTVPDPVSSTDIANRQWVLSVINGGAVSQNAVVVAGTAGETLAAGKIIYLKAADGRWWLASSALAATTNTILFGIAQSAGTAGNSITGGVLVKGIDSHQSGLTGGVIYYLSTSGGISATPGTIERAVGQANTPTDLYFDPYFYYTPTADQKTSLGTTTLALTAGENVTALDALVFQGATNGFSTALVSASSQDWTIAGGSQTGLAINNNITIEGWINLSTIQTSTIVRRTSSGKGYNFIYDNSNGKLTLEINNGAVTYLSPVVILSTGVQYHVAVTLQSATATATFYLNGVAIGTQTTAGTLSSGASDTLTVGGGSGFVNGFLDEVLIWNVVRSAYDILNNLYLYITTEQGLVENWHFKKDATDASGNGNTLTAVGGASFSSTVPFALYTDGSSTVVRGDASNIGKFLMFAGFAQSTVLSGNSVKVYTSGIISGFSSLSPGQIYYLSNTAGAISNGTGTYTRKVGIAVSATQLLITNIY